MSIEISQEQQVESLDWWRRHISRLEARGVATSEELYSLRIHVAGVDAIGYGSGQIRPGDLGQWDVFFALEQFDILYEKRLLLADLSDSAVQREMEKNEMQSLGYNPDDPAEVAEFHRIKGMIPEELDTEINRLESLLCTS